MAVGLREYARKLCRGRWMLVMFASSWRSTLYMVEAVRGLVEPVRIAPWNKPVARTKAGTGGWRWASVHIIAFRKGKAADVRPRAVGQFQLQIRADYAMSLRLMRRGGGMNT